METDFAIQGRPGDTIFIVHPRTERAQIWADENVGEHLNWGRTGIVVEHRFIEDLLEGIQADGFTIERW